MKFRGSKKEKKKRKKKQERKNSREISRIERTMDRLKRLSDRKKKEGKKRKIGVISFPRFLLKCEGETQVNITRDRDIYSQQKITKSKTFTFVFLRLGEMWISPNLI